MTKAEYNRRVIDEEKYALAHEERAIKAAQAREREKQRREIIDGGRARVEAARLQRRAAIERVEQCREYNADLADTVRYESSRIESHLAAGELETLRRNEAHASAARQGRMQALATSRESLFYDRVSRVQQERELSIRRQQSAVDEREAWRAERAALAESVRQQTSDERAEEARRVAYEERASQADAVRREAAQWARAKAEAHGEYARSAVDLATASREASFFSREVALDAAWRRNSALGERGRAERTRRAAMDAVQMQRQHEAKQAMAATVRASKLVSSGNVSMADTAHRLRSAASCSSLGAFSDHHNDHPREEDLFDEELAYPHPHHNPAIDAAVAARYREARPASAPPQRSRPPPPRSPGAASLSRTASNASLSPSRTSSPYAARAAGGFGRSPSGGGAMSPGTRPPPSLNSAASVPRFYTDEGLPYYTGGGGGSPPLSARGSPPRAARWRSSSAPPRPVQSITAHLAARLQQADSDADDSSPPPLRDRFTPDSPRCDMPQLGHLLRRPAASHAHDAVARV